MPKEHAVEASHNAFAPSPLLWAPSGCPYLVGREAGADQEVGVSRGWGQGGPLLVAGELGWAGYDLWTCLHGLLKPLHCLLARCAASWTVPRLLARKRREKLGGQSCSTSWHCKRVKYAMDAKNGARCRCRVATCAWVGASHCHPRSLPRPYQSDPPVLIGQLPAASIAEDEFSGGDSVRRRAAQGTGTLGQRRGRYPAAPQKGNGHRASTFSNL